MRIGLRLRRNGSSARRNGGKSSRNSLRSAGKPVGERAITGSKPFEEALGLRRQVGEGDQGRRELFGGGHELPHQRVGVDREGFEPVEGQPRLVLEGREGAEQRFDVAVAGGGRAEDGVGVADQARRARPGGRARRRREMAPLLKSWLTASRWVSSGAEDAVEFGEGRFEFGEGVGEVGAAAGDRHRDFLHPFLEGGAGPGVEGAEDLVELDRFGDVGLGQGGAVGELWARCGCRASVRRRSRRAASWCAGSPSCPCGIGAYLSSIVDRRERQLAVGARSMSWTLPT